MTSSDAYGDGDEGATAWIDENRELVDSWFSV
jgi:ABC-type proline/glycine betaine transport system substrate-binding protein